jgi:hypothetical protein
VRPIKPSLLVSLALCWVLSASPGAAAVVDWEAPPVADHRVALRCYLPDGVPRVRAILVLVPGLNADGRSLVHDADWMGLAGRTGCALIGCSMRGSEGGAYYDAGRWSGGCFFRGLGELAHLSAHPELHDVPLGFWGHSAGGQWNYNLACWKPERTFAFIANKGAYYDTPANPDVRLIPALWIAGEKDTDERIGNITSRYAESRRRGAPWGLLLEAEVNHAAGRSKEIGMAFLEEALALRVDEGGRFHPVEAGAGWLGDFRNNEVEKNTSSNFGPVTMAWLPGPNTAQLWQSLSRGATAVPPDHPSNPPAANPAR